MEILWFEGMTVDGFHPLFALPNFLFLIFSHILFYYCFFFLNFFLFSLSLSHLSLSFCIFLFVSSPYLSLSLLASLSFSLLLSPNFPVTFLSIYSYLSTLDSSVYRYVSVYFLIFLSLSRSLSLSHSLSQTPFLSLFTSTTLSGCKNFNVGSVCTMEDAEKF